MIDQILGRPSPALRRSQIFLVLFFWLWRLYKGDGAVSLPSRTSSAVGASPSARVTRPGELRKQRGLFFRIWVAMAGKRVVGWIANVNYRLKHFTPYQLILGTLTVTYALRHVGDIFGLGIPEPLAALYTRSFYRATYINTALDAGFSSAMAIRPKWLRDICSVLFGIYYLIWASEGDEVLRKFRALCTVEMLRVTWDKTNNPYIRLATVIFRARLPIVRHVTIPRPPKSSRAGLPPVKAMLFFNGTEEELAKATQLVVDYPGGGFIAMGPECHEERLRAWAKRTGKPVLGVDYGKAPEYPYPWAIEEGFDAYRTLMETKGSCIGIKSGQLGIVLTGDSAGGNICATIMLRILEHPTGIPRPISIIFAYPALDFNFNSWMSPANLRVLRTEQSETNLAGVMHGKDHMRHKSPLSLIDDVQTKSKRGRQRQQSWGQTLSAKLSLSPVSEKVPKLPPNGTSASNGWTSSLPRSMSTKIAGWLNAEGDDTGDSPGDDRSETSDSDDDDARTIKADDRNEAEKSLKERVKTPREERRFDFTATRLSPSTPATALSQAPGAEEVQVNEDPVDQEVVVKAKKKKAPIGTRLTMTSRVGYFQDRIISPSMMRAMAILYIGPKRNPDFETDYYISPILAPSHLLAHFPPVYLICGERDPFVDDTIIFAGRIREAKRARRAQAELASQGRSTRYGESLRMSSGPPKDEIPDHILRETDDDWVQMRIIEGWGHGFMQMTALMKEVNSVLIEMADWIDESFEKHALLNMDLKEVAKARQAVSSNPFPPDLQVMSPEEHIPPPSSTHVKPARDYRPTVASRVLGGADLGTPLAPDIVGNADEDDGNDGTITFTPKNKKRKPPPSRFNPVPRRPSKETLAIHRSGSVPSFDVDDTGSSGEAMSVKTPPLGARSLPMGSPVAKGSGAFAFFNSGRSTSSSGTPKPVPIPASLYGSATTTAAARRASGDSTTSRPTNSLVAAAVAGARAASPALAAAGLVPQSVGNVSEAEVMRRRRLEAVFGLGETESGDQSDDEEDS